MRLAAVDYAVIAFAAVTSGVALALSASQAPFWPSHALHAVAVLAALAAARWVPASGDRWPFLRFGYPVLLFGLFYSDSARYIFLVFDRWFDPALLKYQEAILGFNPVVAIARFDSTWFLELSMFGYAFYYVLAPAAIAVLFRARCADLFRRTVIASCLAFFLSYTAFYLFPLQGPRYALAGALPPLKGLVFYPLVMWIQDAGSIHGGCMPSSHTAVAWIVTYYVARARRTTGRVFAVLSALLTVGCVWGRFHYFADVVAGLLLFAAAVWLTERYNPTGPGRERPRPAPAAALRVR